MKDTKTYGVIVGINEYKDLTSLAWSTKDAIDLAEVLRTSATSAQIELLTDGAATKKAILKKLSWLARRARPNDTAIVYFSGHGGRRSPEEEQSYFCPSDVVAGNLETGITSSELTEALRAIKSERLIVLLDTCYSGGLGEARDIGDSLDAGLNSQDVSDLIEGRGRVILAASRSDERAFEMREEKNGLFTLYLLRALRGEVARPDGTVWVSDVFGYVTRLLREHKRQHPYQKTHGEDFTILVQHRSAQPEQPAGGVVPETDQHQLHTTQQQQPTSGVALSEANQSQLHTTQRQPPTLGVVPPEVDQRQLRQFMLQAFTRAEIQVLCQELGMSFDDLSDHRPLETQIMELIDHQRKRNRYHDLVALVKEERPHMPLNC